jgi:hypothetical protein
LNLLTNYRRAAARRLWGLWAAGVILWTGLLCAPGDWLPYWIGGIGPGGWFTWSKAGHVCGYATLAFFTLVLPAGAGVRLGLLAVLSAHCFLTEYLQTLVPKRTGQLSDVGLDHLGLAAGLALAWLGHRLRPRGERRPPPQQPDEHAAREDQDADLLRHR